MSMMIMSSLYIYRRLYKMSGLMGKVVLISGTNWRINVSVKGIVSTRRIVCYLILFHWIQSITMPGLQWEPLSLTAIKLLILCWDIHLHNQREVLFLIILNMGRPIPRLLLLIFHHRHSLHLQIIIKREIYLDRELKLILIANTSSNNGLNQCGNEEYMVKWTFEIE